MDLFGILALSIRTKSMKTCEDLKNSPYNETGVYTMDPDGSGQPVEVFCDVDKGVTEVRCQIFSCRILDSRQTDLGICFLRLGMTTSVQKM